MIVESQTKSKFTISENSHKIFKLLSTTLYSNKELAVLRELITNAVDASITAKSTKPVEVSIEEKYIRIRDYGTGLTPSEIHSLYTSYGSSSKENDIISTGKFGLGSKSPFAVSPTFTVVSYKDGMKYTYKMILVDIPEYSLTNTEKTSEPNGLEITVPITNPDKYFNVLLDVIAPITYPIQLQSGSKKKLLLLVQREIDTKKDLIPKLPGTFNIESPSYNYGGKLYIVLNNVLYTMQMPDKLKWYNLDIWYRAFDSELNPMLSREGIEQDYLYEQVVNKIYTNIKSRKQKFEEACKILISQTLTDDMSEEERLLRVLFDILPKISKLENYELVSKMSNPHKDILETYCKEAVKIIRRYTYYHDSSESCSLYKLVDLVKSDEVLFITKRNVPLDELRKRQKGSGYFLRVSATTFTNLEQKFKDYKNIKFVSYKYTNKTTRNTYSIEINTGSNSITVEQNTSLKELTKNKLIFITYKNKDGFLHSNMEFKQPDIYMIPKCEFTLHIRVKKNLKSLIKEVKEDKDILLPDRIDGKQFYQILDYHINMLKDSAKNLKFLSSKQESNYTQDILLFFILVKLGGESEFEELYIRNGCKNIFSRFGECFIETLYKFVELFTGSEKIQFGYYLEKRVGHVKIDNIEKKFKYCFSQQTDSFIRRIYTLYKILRELRVYPNSSFLEELLALFSIEILIDAWKESGGSPRSLRTDLAKMYNGISQLSKMESNSVLIPYFQSEIQKEITKFSTDHLKSTDKDLFVTKFKEFKQRIKRSKK